MMTLEEARDVIAPFEAGIHSAVDRAYDRFVSETDATLRIDLFSNVGPLIITNLASVELEREFENDTRVYLLENQNSRFFRFKNGEKGVWVRVAKVDGEYVSCESNASERRYNYKAQLDLGIPGMEKLPQLEVGYQLDAGGLRCVALIFPKPGGVNWQFDLCAPSKVILLNFAGVEEQVIPEPSIRGKGLAARKTDKVASNGDSGEN